MTSSPGSFVPAAATAPSTTTRRVQWYAETAGPSEDHKDHESTVTKVGAEVGYAMSRSLLVDSPMTQTVRSRHWLDNCLGVTTPPGGAPGVGADISGRWMSEAIELLDRLRETQAAALDEAVAVCGRDR